MPLLLIQRGHVDHPDGSGPIAAGGCPRPECAGVDDLECAKRPRIPSSRMLRPSSRLSGNTSAARSNVILAIARPTPVTLRGKGRVVLGHDHRGSPAAEKKLGGEAGVEDACVRHVGHEPGAAQAPQGDEHSDQPDRIRGVDGPGVPELESDRRRPSSTLSETV